MESKNFALSRRVQGGALMAAAALSQTLDMNTTDGDMIQNAMTAVITLIGFGRWVWHFIKPDNRKLTIGVGK